MLLKRWRRPHGLRQQRPLREPTGSLAGGTSAKGSES